MKKLWLLSLVILFVLPGCYTITGLSEFKFEDKDTGTETDTGTGTGADADTDVDTDADGDADTDTDSNTDIKPEISVEMESTREVIEIDDVVEFGDILIGRQTTETFTIHNLGNSMLDISAINISRDVSEYSLTEIDLIPATVSPGYSIKFQISCALILQKTVVLGVSIESNDSDESPYNFMVRGTGVYKPIIEVHMKNSAGEILSDGDTIYAPPVSAGSTTYITFFVANVGNTTLHLQSVTVDSSYFQVFDFNKADIEPAPTVSGVFQEISFRAETPGA